MTAICFIVPPSLIGILSASSTVILDALVSPSATALSSVPVALRPVTLLACPATVVT